MNPTERQLIPVITETDTVRTFVELPAPSQQSVAWTSQAYDAGVYTTSAGVSMPRVHAHVTVDDWDAPAALAKLEAELLQALADVRACAMYPICSIHGVK